MYVTVKTAHLLFPHFGCNLKVTWRFQAFFSPGTWSTLWSVVWSTSTTLCLPRTVLICQQQITACAPYVPSPLGKQSTLSSQWQCLEITGVTIKKPWVHRHRASERIMTQNFTLKLKSPLTFALAKCLWLLLKKRTTSGHCQSLWMTLKGTVCTQMKILYSPSCRSNKISWQFKINSHFHTVCFCMINIVQIHTKSPPRNSHVFPWHQVGHSKPV